MAIRSGFFNSVTGDRKYSAAEFAEYFAAFIGSGVFPDPTTGLQVQATTGMIVKIKIGKAWINGYFLVNDADYTETIAADPILNRIDRYVVRLHYANRLLSIVRKAGVTASSPVAPDVTRDASMYEISLATLVINAGISTITSGMITDTRADANVCGYVSSTITNLPYLTPNKVLVSDSNGELVVGAISTVELGYLSGLASNLQTQLNGKQPTIAGAASTIASSNLTVNRVLLSDGSGKVAVSAVTNTELGYLSGLTSNLQAQLNGKQPTITGGATTIATNNLTINRALVSDENGKVAASAITNAELGFLSGLTGNVQTQLAGKLGSTAQAVDSAKWAGRVLFVQSTAPAGVDGDLWLKV